MTCTFFGHRDAPLNIKPKITKILTCLIEKQNVDTFLIGNNGNFDTMAKQCVVELSKIYPEIKYTIMLAYMPINDGKDYANTIFPSELSFVPYKFAIDKRNRLLIKKADFVVVYVTHVGGASKYKEIAEKQHKTVISIEK